MHYYQHHIGDFLKDTANLDDHQLATYLRMIWSYYGSEKPFDDDCEGIAFAVRSDEKTVRLILKHYFELAEDGWHHNRCDREIEQYKAKAGKARESANARWKNAKAMRTHSEGNANEPEIDANQEPRTYKESKSSCPPQAKDEHLFRFSDIQEAYNRICSPSLPKCAADNKARRTQVKQMVDLEFNGKKPFREFGMKMWESYFNDCLTNPHWVGDNDRGWKADFDFVTKPKNAIKLLERLL